MHAAAFLLPIIGILASDGQIAPWTPRSPRDEIRPAFERIPTDPDQPPESLIIRTDERPGLQGWWESTWPVEGGSYYRFTARVHGSNIPFPRRSMFPRLSWQGGAGESIARDEEGIGPYHPRGTQATATPELPEEVRRDDDGMTYFDTVYRAPSGARQAVIELHLQWATGAKAEWSEIRLEKTSAPPPRRARVATVHFRPSGDSVESNCRQFAPFIAEAAAKKADLIVLPETLTFYGLGKTYAECAEAIPGPSTDYFRELAKQHRVHLVVGLLERDAHVVYNVAVLIGSDGRLIGKYRKVCLPRGESEGGIMPGDAYPVFDTSIGRIGMMVCYDGFFPEVARRLTEAGAEIIAFPVWGCNPMLTAARACENNVYVVSSTYTDVESNWMISGIFGRDGTVLARAETWGSVAMAEIDLGVPLHWAGLGNFGAEMHRNRPPSAREYSDSQATPDIVPAARRPAPPADIRDDQSSSLRIAPRDAQQALATFHTRDRFSMQLLASEPLVEDPVAIEYDEWGKAYVIEMRDYPYTDKTTDKPFVERTTDLPLGRVRVLNDEDGDGDFDTSCILADGLSWPTGIALWKGGAFVTATPDIWYLKDTDGDGRADVRRRVFTGFRKFNVQAVINNLKWGLDHQIYGAGSSNGGKILTEGASSDSAVTMSTNDFRFDPISGSFEALSGGGRFGQSFDDWGNRFICNIRNPIRHAVFPDAPLKRNPLAVVPALVQDVAASGDTIPVYRTSSAEPWRIENATRLAADRLAGSPRSETVAAGYMTSACGLTIYRGSAYPASYYGQAFLGEVAGNLIHRQELVPNGLTFTSRRLDDRIEFVTSDDNWFRPVNFVNAPDGTLHVVDMYRETIEHPWSMPDDLKAQLDLESGRDRGRIYRLAPPDFKYVDFVKLGDLNSEELVAYLRHPNAWQRETAFRLLFERQDPRAVAPLRAMARGESPPAAGDRPRPESDDLCRVLAMWTLDGMRALDDDILVGAMGASAAEVRRHAVKLAASRDGKDGELRSRLLSLAGDSDVRIRFELALALHDRNGDDAEGAWRELVTGGLDPWLNAAIATSAAEREVHVLGWLTVERPTVDRDALDLARHLAEIIGARGDHAECERALDLARDLSTRIADRRSIATSILTGMIQGADRKNHKLTQWLESPRVKAWVREQLEDALVASRDAAREPLSRAESIRLLAQLEWSVVASVVADLLVASESPELQLETVRVALGFREAESVELLLDRYRQLSPLVRVEVLQGLASRPESALALLDAIETGTLNAGDLSPAQRGLLVRSRNTNVQDRAKGLLERETTPERASVVASYRAALGGSADLARGEATYRRACASCHHLRGHGTDVGPPLETVLHRSSGELLLHILDPSRDVLPNYQEYVAQLSDGRTVTGMIAEETSSSVTLRRAGRIDEMIFRDGIDQLVASGKSLMPEGLEKDMNPSEMNDLIQFIRSARPR